MKYVLTRDDMPQNDERLYRRNFNDLNDVWKFVRDILLFFGGLGGVGYETVIATHVEPTLLVVFAAMLGLPAFLNVDKKDSDKK